MRAFINKLEICWMIVTAGYFTSIDAGNWLCKSLNVWLKWDYYFLFIYLFYFIFFFCSFYFKTRLTIQWSHVEWSFQSLHFLHFIYHVRKNKNIFLKLTYMKNNESRYCKPWKRICIDLSISNEKSGKN